MTSAKASGRLNEASEASTASTATIDDNELAWAEAWSGWLRSKRCGCFSCKGQADRYLTFLRAQNPAAVELALALSN